MRHRIKSTDRHSIAEKAGILPGDDLISINNEEIIDFIDYEALSSSSKLKILIGRGERTKLFSIDNYDFKPLGLNFDGDFLYKTRSCKNKCIFCFIDQMKRGGRETLHVKDDDWRYSLVMGNYVTLTNVDDAEFSRIIKRRASPLFISVHSTNGALRKTMMGNPNADRILERLTALKAAELSFHAQIVLCPTINDGDELIRSIFDLYALMPSALSVAVVPVGLTKFRDGLYPLRTMTSDEAKKTIIDIHELQKRFFCESGTRFVFTADEMYIKAGLPLPNEEEYEYYPQIENGVGLLRRFEGEFKEALPLLKKKEFPIKFRATTGIAAYSFMRELMDELKSYNIEIELIPVKNDYFGESVTVTGLLTALDVENALTRDPRPLLIPDNMLRSNEPVFLCGHDLHWLKAAIGADILPINALDGFSFIEQLSDYIEENFK
ncbi:MAG: DUF512 domain-containing protein [Clostridia bacterium]